jgi:hypothetical protein
MQFRDGDATRPNGHFAGPADPQPVPIPPAGPQAGDDAGGSHGSLMQRYRGAAGPLHGEQEDDVSEPLPAASHRARSAATAGPTLGEEQAGDFRQRWRDLQAGFVDDPRQAVRAADDLAREVLDTLAAKIVDKRDVEGWTAGDGSRTEDLRMSLRQHRTLVDRLLEL